MPLAEKEQQYLTAAQGYLDLGMPLDADAELDLIDPFCRHLPEVLELRVQGYLALEKWELMRTAAKRLVDDDPDNIQWSVWLAFATRRAVSIDSAKAILLEAVERHPEASIFHYNLACYESVQGDVEVAKARLQHCFNLDPVWRLKALDDPDLRAVW
jgi:tetratricopeptide (TPR) repeat protein